MAEDPVAEDRAVEDPVPWRRRLERGAADLSVAVVLLRATLRSRAASPRVLVHRTVGAGLIVVVETLGALVLVHRFGSIAGWSAAEIAWLIGVAEAGLGAAMIVGDPLEPPTLAPALRDGRLDTALTAPCSTLVLLTTADVQIRFVGRLVVGLAVVAGASVAAGVDPSPATLGLTVLAVASTAVVVFAVLVIGGAVTVLTREGTELVNAFTYGGTMVAGYPLPIFAPAMRFVFLWIVPVAATVYLPALTVLDKPAPAFVPRSALAVLPLLLAGVVAVAAASWRLALRRYVGTGS